MTILVPVFRVIIIVSIVGSVSIVSRASFCELQREFLSDVCIVCNCKWSKHC